ncbi:MAG TPA: hypothetical protein VIK07_06060 [Bacteroidales bacterium]
MKKLILGFSLALISIFSLNGQWYVKKYHVSDINFLTKEQLEVSLGECKLGLLTSAGVAGLGILAILVAKYGDMSIDDDASVFEQLIGESGKKGIGIVAGVGMFAGGTVASIVFAGRKGSINSALQIKNQSTGSINIAPSLIVNCSLRSLSPGLSIRYKF